MHAGSLPLGSVINKEEFASFLIAVLDNVTGYNHVPTGLKTQHHIFLGQERFSILEAKCARDNLRSEFLTPDHSCDPH